MVPIQRGGLGSQLQAHAMALMEAIRMNRVMILWDRSLGLCHSFVTPLLHSCCCSLAAPACAHSIGRLCFAPHSRSPLGRVELLPC